MENTTTLSLVDQMQSLIENLDVEELEVYYENSKNLADEKETNSINILYYPESKDIIEVANLVQNELSYSNYKRSAIDINIARGLSGELKAIPSIRKEVITFEKNKYNPVLKEDDFRTALIKALLKVSADKIRFRCKFELMGDEEASRWDESYTEYDEADLRYFNELIDLLDRKYPDLLENLEDNKYELSYLREEDLNEVEELLDEFENKMDCCYIRYDFIEAGEV